MLFEVFNFLHLTGQNGNCHELGRRLGGILRKMVPPQHDEADKSV
jgi:hypothetical protein